MLAASSDSEIVTMKVLHPGALNGGVAVPRQRHTIAASVETLPAA